MFFDYAEAGSYAEETLRANRADLERIKLRQRVLVDVSHRDLSTTIIGEKVPLPLGAWRRSRSAACSTATARSRPVARRRRRASRSR